MPDREEIEKLAKDLALSWHSQPDRFYPPDSFWFWIAEKTLANSILRSEHERIVKELRAEISNYVTFLDTEG
jgi:signal recognition particle subunit SEC65